MSVMTKIISIMFNLPPVEMPKLESQIDLEIPMDDGVILLANRVAPIGGTSLPIILIRDPYTFKGKKPDIMSQVIAERGYQVIYQNCRGRWGSGGDFEPFRNERKDGLATLKWISEQPWFSGSVGMYGLSYWGYAQLALGAGAPDYLKALVPQMSASRIYNVFRSNGTLNFFTLMNWLYSTYVTNAKESPNDVQKARKKHKEAVQQSFSQLPISEADKISTELTVPFFQQVISNDKPTDDFWVAMDHSKLVKDINAPVHFVDGWYDFFLEDQLADYEVLRNAGKHPYLTIGPWTHAEIPAFKAGFKESFSWYAAYLKNKKEELRPLPVSVFVMGIKKWVDFPSWPPSCMNNTLFLRKGGELSPEPPSTQQTPSRYTYDPADPTPSIGGSIIEGGGQKNNIVIERRADVLTFTSVPILEKLCVIGQVSVNLFFKSTNRHTDIFARLCDVSPNGKKSINISDGIIRLPSETILVDPEGVCQVTINLQHTAHCFLPGHRIRLQISSGAYPLYARNLGTDESFASGTRMVTAQQEVFHDVSMSSSINLPVFNLTM